MQRPTHFSRRAFLKVVALSGGGLLAACDWSAPLAPGDADDDAAVPKDEMPPAAAGADWQPNAYIRISPDNRVTILVGSSEIGQGTLTAVPMMVAEELDADWSLVSWEQAPVSQSYANPTFATQLTAGSATIKSGYLPQRRAGAAIRAMLVKAAAQRWQLPPEALRTEASFVLHEASGRRASYGELASAAATQSTPANPALKSPGEFRLIGQSKCRLDGAQKADGSARYGIDVEIPGMLTALVARPPRFGGQADYFDAEAARAVPGVVGVYSIPSGIAVVAQDFWSAKLGRDALRIDWNPLAGETLDSETQAADYRARLDLPGLPVRSEGLVPLAQLTAARRLSADYEFPFLAHAPMEPLNVVIDYRGDACEIWCGTQWPDGEVRAAAQVLGLDPAQVTLHPMLSGGGFGRRASHAFDFVSEAAQLAKRLRQPVKLIWTRDDDVRGGYYRPAAACRLTATLDPQGQPSSWTHRVVAQPITVVALAAELGSRFINGFTATEGAATLPYAIPNVWVDLHPMHSGVPTLWMRSVANAFNVYAVETFVDELAQAAGQDPWSFRRELLAAQPRFLGVLDALQATAGPAPAPGLHRGIATFSSYGSYVAQLVEARVGADRALRVERVLSAVDCGIAVNPDLVNAQMESAIVFALSSALFGEITLKDGVVQQSNFHDYPILRLYQTPRIETVRVPSMADPGGVGELGVPCVAPALANAIFAATGERLRSLPLSRHGYRVE